MALILDGTAEPVRTVVMQQAADHRERALPLVINSAAIVSSVALQFTTGHMQGALIPDGTTPRVHGRIECTVVLQHAAGHIQRALAVDGTAIHARAVALQHTANHIERAGVKDGST